jgi:3-methyladenine DNA glycosylase AlkD
MGQRNTDAIAARIVRDVRALPRPNTPAIRAVRVRYSKDLLAAPATTIVALAHALRERGLRWVGYELLHHHRAALASLRIQGVEALAEGLESWDGVDAFGIYIAGPAWRAGQIRDGDIVRWARSSDLWRRRCALVATVVLNSKTRGGGAAGGDAKRTLAIAESLIDDREDMVVKALSWAVRALATVNPRAARAFLAKHDARLARRVVRETNNKLQTGVKTPNTKGRKRLGTRAQGPM